MSKAIIRKTLQEIKIEAILSNCDNFDYSIINDGFGYTDTEPLCDVTIYSQDEKGKPKDCYNGILGIEDLESIIQASQEMIVELKRKRALKPKLKKRVKK